MSLNIDGSSEWEGDLTIVVWVLMDFIVGLVGVFPDSTVLVLTFFTPSVPIIMFFKVHM